MPFGIIVIYSLFLVAQDKLHSHSSALMGKGDSLYMERSFTEGIGEFKKAISIAKSKKDWNIVAKNHNLLARGYFEIQEIEETKSHLDSAMAIVENKGLANPAIKAMAFENFGKYYNYRSKRKDAIKSYKNALALYKQLDGVDEQLFTFHQALTLLGMRSGDRRLGEFHLSKMQEVSDRNKNANPAMLSKYYNVAGRIASVGGRHEKAIEYLKKAFGIIKKMPEKKEIDVAMAEYSLGLVYYNARNHEMSLRHSINVYPILKKYHGEGNPAMNSVYSNLARMHSRLGQFSAALNFNKKALALVKSVHEENHQMYGHTYSAIASTYDRMRDYDNALIFYRKAIENHIQNLGPNHEKLIFLYGNVANILNSKGEYQKALKETEKSIKIGIKNYGKNSNRLTFSYQKLGETLIQLGKKEEAFKALEQALLIRKDNFGENHWETDLSYLAHGEFYKYYEEDDQAIYYFKKVLNNHKDLFDDTYSLNDDHLFDNMKNAFEANLGIAQVYAKAYAIEGSDEVLKKCLEEYKKTDVLSLRMREATNSEGDRRKLGEVNKVLFEGAIWANGVRFKKTQDSTILNRLLYYFERSRANALAESLSPKTTSQVQGLGASLNSIKELNKKKVTFKVLH